MTTMTPKTKFLTDYAEPAFRVSEVHLHFELDEVTVVRSRCHIQRQGASKAPLILDGQDFELRSVAIDGHLLAADDYLVCEEQLTIYQVPDQFILEIETALQPAKNTALEGLYRSSGMFCTQCEPEGFRRITYFPDRPDVMARYTTTVSADMAQYPVLLSNGNPVAHGGTVGGRHWVTWEDPFPKPSYLFALVAGDLDWIEDKFVTHSGRSVALKIYVDKGNADKCRHAMESLKRAMAWDEQVYGCEYDLAIYNIVAVNDFNMGAMENKGLNIFNAKYVLAKPETATDTDFAGIESVIGHEYFHNWTGNRVTCRDWFQLSLKEGLTVFRDQEFSADMASRAVKRIDEVNYLRTFQFPEDAGPMTHSVRPSSYVEINNFYTATVYNKGAELIRMMHALLGAERYRKGTDLYFQRHDGQAVTTDDFVKAMEDASGYDLAQFKRWYEQPGTPVVKVEREYRVAEKKYILRFEQHLDPTPGQSNNLPMHIPIAFGLLGSDGQELATPGNGMLEIRERQQQFEFTGVLEQPVPSLLRGFSAPIKLVIDYTDEELAFLVQNDADAFCRWEAWQLLATRSVMALIKDANSTISPLLARTLQAVLNEIKPRDKALNARLVALPSEANLAEAMLVVEPDKIRQARLAVSMHIATVLRDDLLRVYRQNNAKRAYAWDAQSTAERALKNNCLRYLTYLNDASITSLCVGQFYHSDNMTDGLAALEFLADIDSAEREDALAQFYERWHQDPLVVDKWLAIQASSTLPQTLDVVRGLTQHAAFAITNPNKVRALIGSFSRNLACFHDMSGAGYKLMEETVLRLNALNPQVAARILTPLTHWRRYDSERQAKMRAVLESIAKTPDLAKDVFEVVSKSLVD